MLPVSLVREVPADPDDMSVFWKIIAGAALASFLTVLLLAWHISRQPPERLTAHAPVACEAH